MNIYWNFSYSYDHLPNLANGGQRGKTRVLIYELVLGLIEPKILESDHYGTHLFYPVRFDANNFPRDVATNWGEIK